MDEQLRNWLQYVVTISPFQSRDVRGKKIYGPDYCVGCYASGEVKMVRSLSGDEVVSTETLYFDAAGPAADISFDDKIVFPGGKEPVILSKKIYRDAKGKPQVVEVNF